MSDHCIVATLGVHEAGGEWAASVHSNKGFGLQKPPHKWLPESYSGFAVSPTN
jgi:hypothetical protein